MELVLGILSFSTVLIVASVLYFCLKVIHIVDKDRVIQHQIVEEKPVFTPQTLSDKDFDTINPLDESEQPLDQFSPDFKKPLKVKFVDEKDEYTEMVDE